MIAVVDYGAGNLKSVVKAFTWIGSSVRVVGNAGELAQADRVVLPGVGAFGAAMDRLTGSGIRDALYEFLLRGRPFMGICLGMQLLVEGSEESPGCPGMSLFPGRCVRFREGKVPHMGWNRIVSGHEGSSLLRGISRDAWFYFVHSYCLETLPDPIRPSIVRYHREFVALFEAEHIHAVQFHPEKSGADGLGILRNWVQQ